MQNISAVSIAANVAVSAFVELTAENLTPSPFGWGFAIPLSRGNLHRVGIWSCPGFLTKQTPKVWAGITPVRFDQLTWRELVGEHRQSGIQEIKLSARVAKQRLTLCPV